MEHIDVPLWWEGAGRYWMSNGRYERQLGYCRYVEELVDAVKVQEAAGFDLHGAIIVRSRSGLTYEQWLASHLPDVPVDD